MALDAESLLSREGEDGLCESQGRVAVAVRAGAVEELRPAGDLLPRASRNLASASTVGVTPPSMPWDGASGAVRISRVRPEKRGRIAQQPTV